MTVGTHLTALASRLVLTSSEKSSIDISTLTLDGRLRLHFGGSITQTFKFGSFTRGTILPRKADTMSDVDYMVVFDTTEGRKTPQAYLDRLRRFANQKYSTSEIAQSTPTIILNLNHIRFELVPAIWSGWDGLKIPSPKSHWEDWMPTDPSEFNQTLVSKNKFESNQIKPLVRLVKYWNSQNGHHYNSYELEQYIVNRSYWLCTTQKDYFYSFWDNFNYTWDTAQYIKNKVDRAKSYAIKAKEYERILHLDKAEHEIKKIVPDLL